MAGMEAGRRKEEMSGVTAPGMVHMVYGAVRSVLHVRKHLGGIFSHMGRGSPFFPPTA